MIFCSVFISKWAACSTFKICNVYSNEIKEGAMRKIVSLLILLAVLFGVAAADARGGRSDAECPPKSTDPDCK
jgi:hypothetical protein